MKKQRYDLCFLQGNMTAMYKDGKKRRLSYLVIGGNTLNCIQYPVIYSSYL